MFRLEGGMGQQGPFLGKQRTEESHEKFLCRLEGSNSNNLSHQFWLGHHDIHLSTYHAEPWN